MMQRRPEPEQRPAKSIEVSVLLKDGGGEEEFSVSSWSLSEQGRLSLVLDAGTGPDEVYQVIYPAGSFDRVDVHVEFEPEAEPEGLSKAVRDGVY